MKRSTPMLRVALVLVGLCAASSSFASEAEDWSEREQIEHWSHELRKAWEHRNAARERLEAAEYAYQDWRQRKHPRGTRKAELVAEIEAARLELAAAETALPQIHERARRAGVPPGVLRLYDDSAPPVPGRRARD